MRRPRCRLSPRMMRIRLSLRVNSVPGLSSCRVATLRWLFRIAQIQSLWTDRISLLNSGLSIYYGIQSNYRGNDGGLSSTSLVNCLHVDWFVDLFQCDHSKKIWVERVIFWVYSNWVKIEKLVCAPGEKLSEKMAANGCNRNVVFEMCN